MARALHPISGPATTVGANREETMHGYGPYDIISSGEIAATLIMLVVGFTAMLFMAYRTRHTFKH